MLYCVLQNINVPTFQYNFTIMVSNHDQYNQFQIDIGNLDVYGIIICFTSTKNDCFSASTNGWMVHSSNKGLLFNWFLLVKRSVLFKNMSAFGFPDLQ